MKDQAHLPSYCRPVFLDRVDSTNDAARAMAIEGAPHLTVVVAKEQRAGRGRQGRGWISPPGNLYCSVVLRPACPPRIAAQIGIVASLSARLTIAEFVGGSSDVLCKWPNDVLIGDEKVAGILLESAARTAEKVDWLVLGIGVNIDSAPAESDRPATCLVEAGAEGCTPAQFLETWVPLFVSWYVAWEGDGFAEARAAWLAYAAGLGDDIEVRLGTETLEGRFADLDASGALVLDQPTGERRLIAAGDVYALGS